MSTFLANLPALAEVQRTRRATPKGRSRLQQQQAEKKLTLVDEKAFKAEVWARDKGRCRKCGRTVTKTIARVPERGEIHHVHGRVGDLRFEARAALLLCLSCHELVTGRVNEKWVIEPAKQHGTFQVLAGGVVADYIDARKKLKFTRVV